MRILRIVAVCSVFLAAMTVSAQNNRSAVSINGLDTNASTVPAPCRTFGVAISKTNAGGDVIALDSGGYGGFTVDRAVSVLPAPGVYAGIVATSGNAITVNAPGAEVELRNLTIRGFGTGSNGIKFDSGSALHIEHCVISGFTLRGVETQISTSANLYINDSSFRDCDSAVLASTSSGTLKVAIDGTRAENTVNAAFYASDNSRVTVRNSVAAGSGVAGFRVLVFSAVTAEMNVENCMSSNNLYGLLIDSNTGTSILRASNMIITNNDTGMFVGGSGGTKSIITFGNNSVAGNTTNGAFTSSISQQ
jgi:hypothetical protein